MTDSTKKNLKVQSESDRKAKTAERKRLEKQKSRAKAKSAGATRLRIRIDFWGHQALTAIAVHHGWTLSEASEILVRDWLDPDSPDHGWEVGTCWSSHDVELDLTVDPSLIKAAAGLNPALEFSEILEIAIGHCLSPRWTESGLSGRLPWMTTGWAMTHPSLTHFLRRDRRFLQAVRSGQSMAIWPSRRDQLDKAVIDGESERLVAVASSRLSVRRMKIRLRDAFQTVQKTDIQALVDLGPLELDHERLTPAQMDALEEMRETRSQRFRAKPVRNPDFERRMAEAEQAWRLRRAA